MGKVKSVSVTFINGPLHLIAAKMDWIPELEIFTDERDQTVYAYQRDELTYYFNPELSAQLTEKYPEVKKVFRENEVEITGEMGVDEDESIDSEE